MLTRVVKLHFDAAYLDQFLAHFETVKWQVAQFPGCKGMQLLQDQTDSCLIFTYSIWDSEDALNNYRNSALFAAIWPQIKPWFDQKPEAWSLNQHFSAFI
jgi:quinol monooxygenase YgiN